MFPRRKDVDIYAIDSCQGGGWRVYGDGGQVPIGLWPELDYEGEARQTSETIHKAVEDFVGDAERSDDLTKMCIKMHN